MLIKFIPGVFNLNMHHYDDVALIPLFKKLRIHSQNWKLYSFAY